MLDHTITASGKLSDWSLGPHQRKSLHKSPSGSFQSHFRHISELSTGSSLGVNVPSLAETPQVL